MVLEEASTSPDSFSDIDNSSDGDSRPSDWRYGYSYPIAQFAKLAPLSGFSSAYAKAKIDVHLAMLSQLAQRRLTDKEVQINARNIATGVSVNSYAVLLGWAGATFQVYRKMNMLTLPFWDLEKRGYSFDRFGPLRGQMSRVAWQAVRIGVYGQCWAVVTGFAGFAWANGYVQLQLQTDPDLKDLLSAIKLRSPADRKADKDAVIRTISEHVQLELGLRPENVRASSTATEGDTYSPTDIDTSTETNMISDAQRTRYEREVNASAKRPKDGPFPSRTAPSPERTESSYHDESSPTGGQGPFDYGSSSKNQTAGGSAWDRVRQQASNNQPVDTTSSQPQKQRSWLQPQKPSEDENGSGFSDKSENSQMARAQAQKEFDAQLERERKGSANSEGSFKRW